MKNAGINANRRLRNKYARQNTLMHAGRKGKEYLFL
jgi:hypothetical protein